MRCQRKKLKVTSNALMSTFRPGLSSSEQTKYRARYSHSCRRHGSCLHRLDKGAKVSLRKGWWQTGERTKIKVQQSHKISVSTSLETKRSTFQASDIETNLRWTPDQVNASPCLQRYLNALQSGEYFGKGHQGVATDGSLRLIRSSTKEPAMRAGVMWHNATLPHRSEQVGGQHSSTRAELAAVVMALHGTPRADDLAILIDSAQRRIYKDYDGFVVMTSDRHSTRSRTTTSSMTFCLNSSCDQNHPHELFL